MRNVRHFTGRRSALRRYGVVLAVLLLASAGCRSTAEPEVRTRRVLVPVAVPPPAPPLPDRPTLPLAALDSASTPRSVMRAYVASTYLLMGYAEQLETMLRGYHVSADTLGREGSR